MTENEKNLKEIEEMIELATSQSDKDAYKFQKQLLEEEMAREAEQAASATPPIQQTAVPVAPTPKPAAPVVPSINTKGMSAEELYREGTFSHNRDKEKAFIYFSKAAELGHAEAQFFLSGYYEDGDVVPKDYAKAIEWARKSAEQGCAEGQSHLGRFYFIGKGVEQDYAKAAEWFSKAAAQGHKVSQVSLNMLKEVGWI